MRLEQIPFETIACSSETADIPVSLINHVESKIDFTKSGWVSEK